MKITHLTTLKHNLQWLVPLVALLGVNIGATAQVVGEVYAGGVGIYITAQSTKAIYYHTWDGGCSSTNWGERPALTTPSATIYNNSNGGGFYGYACATLKGDNSAFANILFTSNTGSGQGSDQTGTITLQNNNRHMWIMLNEGTKTDMMYNNTLSASDKVRYGSASISGETAANAVSAKWDAYRGKFIRYNQSWSGTSDRLMIYLGENEYLLRKESQSSGSYNIEWNPFTGDINFATASSDCEQDCSVGYSVPANTSFKVDISAVASDFKDGSNLHVSLISESNKNHAVALNAYDVSGMSQNSFVPKNELEWIDSNTSSNDVYTFTINSAKTIYGICVWRDKENSNDDIWQTNISGIKYFVPNGTYVVKDEKSYHSNRQSWAYTGGWECPPTCTQPDQQDVYIGSSGTTSGSFSICSSGSSTSIWLNASEEGYSYQLKKQNGASWNDVGVAWSNVNSGTDGHEFSGITAAANYKIVGYPTSDGSSSSCARDMLNQVTLSHYDNMALSDVSIDASSVCKSGTTTIRTSGANIGGTGVVNYDSSNSSIVAVSSTSTASATLTGGSTAGEATITVSVSGGCGSTPASKTATLTVNPDTDLSGAKISFTPSATCNGNGTVASISEAQLGGGTGAWSWESGTGKGSINATTGLISGVTTATTGSHTFRYTVTGGCGSNDKTKDENVTLGYSPIVSPITKTVKAYEPVSLTCTNANVTWAVNGGETPTHYIYDSSKRSTKFKAAPGTYMVTATNATMTCPGASTIVVEADPACEEP